jgi:hypothetical protein
MIVCLLAPSTVHRPAYSIRGISPGGVSETDDLRSSRLEQKIMICLAFSARHGAAQRQRTSTMRCSATGRASSPSLEHKCMLSLPAASPSPPSIGNGDLPTCSCRGETELVVVPAPPPGQQRASRLSSAIPCPSARMLLRRDTSPYGGRNIRRGGWQL